MQSYTVLASYIVISTPHWSSGPEYIIIMLCTYHGLCRTVAILHKHDKHGISSNVGSLMVAEIRTVSYRVYVDNHGIIY